MENGCHINFWLNPWLKANTTLRSLIYDPILPHEESSTIAHYRSNTSWQLHNLSFKLAHDILQKISSIYLSHNLSYLTKSFGLFLIMVCFRLSPAINPYFPLHLCTSSSGSEDCAYHPKSYTFYGYAAMIAFPQTTA